MNRQNDDDLESDDQVIRKVSSIFETCNTQTSSGKQLFDNI